jgi:hypothetical protein
MFGEPSDKERECNARLFIADNYGDGTASIRCQLAPGHEGLHQEQFERRGHTVTITWAIDERERCSHGCGQWEHAHKAEDDYGAILCSRDADDHEFSDCAFCNPEVPAQTCGYCGKTHYYEEGHLRHCAKKPFTCKICGESGIGNHEWPSGCPKEIADFIARGNANDMFSDDNVPPTAATAPEEPPQS